MTCLYTRIRLRSLHETPFATASPQQFCQPRPPKHKPCSSTAPPWASAVPPTSLQKAHKLKTPPAPSARKPGCCTDHTSSAAWACRSLFEFRCKLCGGPGVRGYTVGRPHWTETIDSFQHRLCKEPLAYKTTTWNHRHGRRRFYEVRENNPPKILKAIVLPLSCLKKKEVET